MRHKFAQPLQAVLRLPLLSRSQAFQQAALTDGAFALLALSQTEAPFVRSSVPSLRTLQSAASHLRAVLQLHPLQGAKQVSLPKQAYNQSPTKAPLDQRGVDQSREPSDALASRFLHSHSSTNTPPTPPVTSLPPTHPFHSFPVLRPFSPAAPISEAPPLRAIHSVTVRQSPSPQPSKLVDSLESKLHDASVPDIGTKGAVGLNPFTKQQHTVPLPPLPPSAAAAFERHAAQAYQGEQEHIPKPTSDDQHMTARGCYIARRINLGKLVEGAYPDRTVNHRGNNVIVRFKDRKTPPTGHKQGAKLFAPRWMIVFDYGALVFFNFDQSELAAELQVVSQFCETALEERMTDDYGVFVRHSLEKYSVGGPDYVLIRDLNENAIRVIGSILGQSVALDHYTVEVDRMISRFGQLNKDMMELGSFTITRKDLFKLIGVVNTTITDVIIKLELLNRSDTAWKFADYGKIWEYMRGDFDIADRFDSLNYKLSVIQANVKFFLGVLQNRKSDTLEWIIIALISAEIILGIYDILRTAAG